MSKRKPSRSQETETVSDVDVILPRLEKFRVIHNPRIKTFFGYLPVLLVLLIVVDWLIGTGNFSRDTFRMTGVLTVAIILAGIQVLFERFPKALESIWRRGVIDSSSEHGSGSSFLAYIDQVEASLNSKYEWLVALVCSAGALFATYPFRYYVQAKHFPFDFWGMLGYYFGLQAAVVAPILGIIVGVLLWRVGVIAYFIGRIGDKFPLKIQVNHQDQCGGLKPIGDLAFYIAIIILIPSIFLSVWGFITTVFDNPSLQLYITLWGGLFRQMLVLLSLFSILTFIQPLYKIHVHMEANAHLIKNELDNLSRRIETLSFELRSQADILTPELGEEKLRAIEFMKKVYEENKNIPTWPFSWKTVTQFAGAQVVPMLSLIGTSGPVVEIIKGLFSLTQ